MVYLDAAGEGQATNYVSVFPDLDTTAIGGWISPGGVSRDFNGTIDEVILYDSALPLAEVQQIFCAQGGTGDFC
jgi:hypothetical protein